jgi:hypothetical protein
MYAIPGFAMINNDSFNTLIAALCSGFEEEQKQHYEKVAMLPAVHAATLAVRINDFESFDSQLLRPFEDVVDGLLASELPSCEDAQFLFKHSQFIERHVEAIIRQYEGAPCCADKARTVVRHLLGYWKSGDVITFDYTQKYTFHLPEKVLVTHDEIVQFFDALKRLYYGNVSPLLTVHLNMANRLNGAHASN